MGQYDYQGTPQSRMYDWLVTREGEYLVLCEPDLPIGSTNDPSSIEQEDLDYIRNLVRADDLHSKSIHAVGEIPGVITDRAAQDAVDNAVRPKPVDDDPNKPAPATGGVDYYDMVDPQTGKKKGLPEALGPAPPPTRRHLDKDGQWQEGDRPLHIPTEDELKHHDQEEPTDA